MNKSRIIESLVGLNRRRIKRRNIEFVHYPSSSTCVKISVDIIDLGGMVLEKQKKTGMCPKK